MIRIIVIFFILICLTNCGPIPKTYKSQFYDSYSQADAGQDPDGVLKFRFMDVGQGDATLITTPNGRYILIDAGTADMGREKVLPYLVENNINLELIIASHFDADHIGGIPEVIKGPDGIINTGDDIVPIQGVLDRGRVEMIDTVNLSDYFIITSGYRFSMNPGDEFESNGVRFLILAQNGEFSDGYIEDIDPENENAHSISLLISYGNIDYLTSGDLPGPNFENIYEPFDLESRLTELVDRIDILHVSHHGSHNSTSPEFLGKIQPGIAIISVGENDYGHPHGVVFENLYGVGAEVYITRDNGDICVETDGASIGVITCSENRI